MSRVIPTPKGSQPVLRGGTTKQRVRDGSGTPDSEACEREEYSEQPDGAAHVDVL